MNYFDPSGPVVSFTASTTAPTSQQAKSNNFVETPIVMMANTSSNVGVTVGWGASDADAKNQAASTVSANQFFLAPNMQIVVCGKSDGFYSGVTTTNTAVVFVQPGIQS